MLPNAFVGKTEPPTDDELTAELGTDSKALWDQMISGLADEYGLVREWNSYSRKAGWAMRLKRGKRNILYLSPCRGCFTVSFVLGDKAVRAAREARLPAKVIQMFDGAPRYVEGTVIRIEVKRPKDLPVIQRLAAVKLEN